MPDSHEKKERERIKIIYQCGENNGKEEIAREATML